MANSGSLVGSPVFATGRFGNGLTGLSDTNYVLLPSWIWPTGGPFTIEAWLKITGTAIAVAISTEWWMGMDSSGNFAGSVMDGTTVGSGISINDGAWHHCAMVLSGGVLTLFVDGVPGASVPVTYAAPMQPLMIGRYSALNGFPWAGTIDEVAFFPYAKYTGPFTVTNVPYNGSEPFLLALYHLEADATNSAGAVAPLNNTVDPSNSAIVYSPFNWNVSQGYARTICSGAYFRTIFSGTSLSLCTDTTPSLAPFSQLWVRIDNQGWVQYSLSAGNPTIAVAAALPSGKHIVEVLVKSTTQTVSRWFPAITIVQITGLLLDQGATLSSPIRRTKNVLIFGDSISEGTNAITTPSLIDVNRADALGCYSYALAAALDAEVGIVAFGGMGVNNYGSAPPLTQSFNYFYGWVPRSFSSPPPDLVIYNQGTNDGGDVSQGLQTVIAAILALAPNSKHLVLNPFNGSHKADLQAAVSGLNNPNVVYQSTTGWFNPADSIDGLHPYNYAHVELIAPRLYPIVTALLAAPTSSGQSVKASTELSASASSALYAFR